MNFTQQQITYLKQYIAKLRPSVGGKLFYYCIPFRKKVVLQNMRQVFGDNLTPQEIYRLAQAFYSHLFRSLIENIALRFMTERQLYNHAEVLGEEYMWDLLNNKIKGAILITGHFGNWEFAPIAGILHFPQFKNRFYFVRKTLTNKKIERLVFRRYYKAGLQVISKRNSLNKVCNILETNNAVLFIMDQHASIEARDGVIVDFLGKAASTFKSPAMIAKYTDVPVLPVRSYRRKDGKHILEFFPRIEWISCNDDTEEIKINTRRYNEILEKFIMEYPDQWLWMHRRWKTT